MMSIESKEEISDTDSGIIIHSGKENTNKILIIIIYLIQIM